MFYIRKPGEPKQNSVIIIRPATLTELSNYEARKLISAENSAQENKIEIINTSGLTPVLTGVIKNNKII